MIRILHKSNGMTFRPADTPDMEASSVQDSLSRSNLEEKIYDSKLTNSERVSTDFIAKTKQNKIRARARVPFSGSGEVGSIFGLDAQRTGCTAMLTSIPT